MTAEERAKECLELNKQAADNDSWYLPVDLEARIVKAIQDAESSGWNAAVEACANSMDEIGAIYYKDEGEESGGRRFSVKDAATVIRALSTVKAEAAKAEG